MIILTNNGIALLPVIKPLSPPLNKQVNNNISSALSR